MFAMRMPASCPLEFHVIGSTDQNAVFAGLGNVRVWGRYKEREVYARLAAVRCHVAFLPSLWPETFMYTLSVAMASRNVHDLLRSA